MNNTAGGNYMQVSHFNYCPYCGHSLSGPHAPGYYGQITSYGGGAGGLGTPGTGGPTSIGDVGKK